MAFNRKAYNKGYNQRPGVKARQKEQMKWAHLKRKYGLTKDQCYWLLLAQAGKCAICGEELGDDWVVDHCHKTRAIRGLLHRTCNVGLGHFADNPVILRKAADYLESEL